MMVLRKLAIALLGLGVMLPGLSHALTVGPGIDVKSALGEPFHGQVALSDLGDLSVDDIKVSLATQEDFDLFGIQKAYFLTDLRFNVIINPSGGSYIDVVSSKPVDEPVLDFVIHVVWPGNQKLNDMVALLDPPVQAGASTTLSQSQTPAVTPVAPTIIASSPQGATTAPSAPAPAPEALPARPAAAYRHGRRPRTPEDAVQAKPAPAAHEQASGASASSYDVHSGDTLWVIAEKVRPSDSVTVSQTMIALQKKNPDSFSNSNINQLKSGETLDVPNESQIRDVSAEQALASVREQNKAWRGMTGQSSKPAKLEAQQVDATAKPQAAPKPAAGPSKAEMKLLAQEGSGKNASGSAGAEAKGVSKTDAKKLKENKLKADAAKKDNEKLASKVGTLDSQVKANDKQLAVQNAKLAELQAQLKEQAAKAAAKSTPAPAPTPAHVAAAPAPAAASAPMTAALPAASAMAASGAPEGVVASAAASAPKLASKHLPETTIAPPPAETEESGLPYGLIGIAGGAVALLFGGFVFMSKRKKQKQAAALDALDSFDDHAAQADNMGFGAADADESSGFTDDHEAYRNADLGSLEPSGLTAEVPMFRDTPAADPLDEVEQYLAYERYPQAVGFLNKAISAQPERTDLRLKLMEIYVRLQDTHGFEEQEAALADSSDLGVLARIEELKTSLPALPKAARDEGVIDYDGPATRKSMGSTDDSLPSLEELEMDFNATVSASNPNMKALDDTQLGAAAIPSASSEELLDFNFDSGGALEDHDFSFKPEATTKAVVEPPPAAPVMNSDLSFTLDEPEPVEAPVSKKAQQGRDLDVSGMSLGDSIELADFETAPELAEPEVHTTEEDLSFSLDDLDLAAPAAPANELHDALDGDFSLEESAASSADADEVKLDHVMAESGLNDMAALFDDALAEHQASSGQAPAPVAAAAPAAPAPAPAPVNMTSPGLGIDDEFDFLADTDENATKLDLAKAYIDMGDMEGAKDILNEVLSEGNSGQKDEAKTLLAQVG